MSTDKSKSWEVASTLLSSGDLEIILPDELSHMLCLADGQRVALHTEGRRIIFELDKVQD
jgi:hypothetical protein